jgi:hypothetical protein
MSAVLLLLPQQLAAGGDEDRLLVRLVQSSLVLAVFNDFFTSTIGWAVLVAEGRFSSLELQLLLL